MRRYVTEPLQRRERKIRRGCLKSEAFADHTRERRRMIERIQAGKDATGAMPKQEHGKARVSGPHEVHKRRDIAYVVDELVDVESFAVGSAASTEVYGVRRPAHPPQSLNTPAAL